MSAPVMCHNFDYDAQAPLEVCELSTRKQAGSYLGDITYAVAPAVRASAYLVQPVGAGPFAGVVFLHWGGGDRSEFLDEATQLAHCGVVSLLMDAPWHWPGYVRRGPDETAIHTVVALRRAVDLLTARPDVDAQRLGYVGHSFGATWGGVLAGLESRLTAYVLMAGYARPSQYYPSDAPKAHLDGIHYIGQAAPAALFFQFAHQDEYVSTAAALEFYAAAGQPKQIAWYQAAHALNEQARRERVAWLAQQLGLDQAALVSGA